MYAPNDFPRQFFCFLAEARDEVLTSLSRRRAFHERVAWLAIKTIFCQPGIVITTAHAHASRQRAPASCDGVMSDVSDAQNTCSMVFLPG